MNPALILLGPSGAGKTTTANELVSREGWHHVDADLRGADGIDVAGLRAEWDKFYCRCDAVALAAALRARCGSANGCVLTLPSLVVPTANHLRSAAEAKIHVLILYATAAACLSAFLERERATGGGLGEHHWLANNTSSYAAFSRPELASFRVNAFTNAEAGRRHDLLNEILARVR